MILRVAPIRHVRLPCVPQRLPGRGRQLPLIQIRDRGYREHPEHVARRRGEKLFQFLRTPRRVLMTPELRRDLRVPVIALPLIMRVSVDHRELALVERRLGPQRDGGEKKRDKSHCPTTGPNFSRFTTLPSNPCLDQLWPASFEMYKPSSRTLANIRPRVVGWKITATTSGDGRPALRDCHVFPPSSEIATPGPHPATAIRFSTVGSKATS